jgi:ABC-type phosphate transport system permease subunit
MNRLRAAFRTILAELNTPSAQRDQWFLWCAAQMAHALIGVVMAGALMFFIPAWCAFGTTALGYALAKEIPDFLRERSWANARDCVQDTLFVTAGAALAVAIEGGHVTLFLAAVFAAAIGLVWGTLIRLKARP